MNIKRNKWILRIAMMALIAVSLIVIQNTLEYKSPHGINQTRAFYEQPKNSIDVLAIGSSHVHCGVNTAELWSKYGIAAYDFTAAEQPFWITYYYLKEAYKYQSPEVVILDVFSAARFKEDYHYKWLEESVYGLRFSKNKLDMLNVSIEDEYRSDYFPSFLSYHNRYIDLNKEDLYNIFGNHREKRIFKGFTPGFNVVDQSERFGGWDELEDYHLTPKYEEYLNKIIELTKEHGSKLVIIVVPYNLDERDNVTYEEIANIAKAKDVTFIDFNSRLDDIGIDKSTDFNDHTHLNYYGSVKFSDHLGDILKNEADLPDRRGNSGYETWDEFANKILNEANSK